MNKYQVTINLVVEVEADTEDEAWSEAKNSIDYGHGDVVEEDVIECVVLEFHCAECHEEMDPYNDDCYDGAMMLLRTFLLSKMFLSSRGLARFERFNLLCKWRSSVRELGTKDI